MKIFATKGGTVMAYPKVVEGQKRLPEIRRFESEPRCEVLNIVLHYGKEHWLPIDMQMLLRRCCEAEYTARVRRALI